jgi:hypothetical protein
MRRRNWGGRQRAPWEWAEYHREQRALVKARFGGIDEHVLAAFFGLGSDKLAYVFALYARQYGPAAGSYAKRAFSRWQRGEVQPSGKTLERLLDIVPQVLDFTTKVELYRHLRDAHRRPDRLSLKVAGEAELELVEKAAWRIVDRAHAIPLPAEVDARLSWLSQGDGLAARRLVAEVELREGALIADILRSELAQLADALRTSSVNPKATHEINLPCGAISIEFTQPRWWRRPKMSNDNEQHDNDQTNRLPARRDEQALARPVGDIIDQALQQMVSVDDSQEIVVAAQREALRLAAKQREGAMDSSTAKREVSEFLEQAHEANVLRDADYEMDADFKRATGRTHISVRRKRRWWWPF